MNAALLSRTRVVTLRPLEEEELLTLLHRALQSPQGLGGKVQADDDALAFLARSAGGDARRALTTLEVAAAGGERITVGGGRGGAAAKGACSTTRRATSTTPSSPPSSSRCAGSDPDAALYWMTRMLEAGEDPRFVLRRMVIFASEDVGNADPQALGVAVAALQAYELMGLPGGDAAADAGGDVPVAGAEVERGDLRLREGARRRWRSTGRCRCRSHLRQASTPLMRKMGYGKDYRYPHDFPGHWVAQQYLPDALVGTRFYEPSDSGAEEQLRRRLAELRAQEGKVKGGGDAEGESGPGGGGRTGQACPRKTWGDGRRGSGADGRQEPVSGNGRASVRRPEGRPSERMVLAWVEAPEGSVSHEKTRSHRESEKHSGTLGFLLARAVHPVAVRPTKTSLPR